MAFHVFLKEKVRMLWVGEGSYHFEACTVSSAQLEHLFMPFRDH